MLVNFTHKTKQAARRVWQFLRPRKFGLVSFVIISTFILVAWFGLTEITHAGFSDILNWTLDILSSVLLYVAEWFIKLTIFILKFVIEVAGYNGYIDSPAVIVGWVMVRDVVNMFFVVILLVIAFGTILGLQSYEWSKLLMKLLLAAVLVNFSRIIAGVVIDVTQVVMITFINGVAATAGGNLINMFNLQGMAKLTSGTELTGGSKFLASVAALTFSGMMMMTMAVYLFMLMARMVMLWILIVLSPLAFVLKVLPQTEKFGTDWWKEFSGNAIGGPVIAFFLWLAFVTAGSGTIYNDIEANSAVPPGSKLSAPTAMSEAGQIGTTATTGITDIMSWASMANFFIAIGMLLAGAKTAQSLGAAGAGAMSKVGDFGKKIAMVASGARAGMWAGRGVMKGAKATGKWAAMSAPLVGGKAWQRRGAAIKLGALDVGTRWNEAVGGSKAGWLGRQLQVGRHAKIMEEREKQIKSKEGRLRTATNVEELKKQTDIVEGQDVTRKAGSEAKRQARRAGAQEAYLQTPEGAKYMEKMKAAEEKEADLARVKTNLETAYAKGGGGMYLAEARAQAEKAKLELETAQKEVAQFAEKVVGLPKAQAEKEQKEMEITRSKEIVVAEARDAEISKKTPGVESTTFADDVRARHTAEDLKRESVASWDKAMMRVDALNAEIGRLSSLPARTPEQGQQLKALQVAHANATLANISRGQIYGGGAIDATLKRPGIGRHNVEQTLDDTNLMAQQANILAAHLGKSVAATGSAIDDALAELETNMGPAFMEEMMDRLNIMADDGAVGYAGNFRQDSSTNKVRRTIMATDEGYIEGKRDWAVSQSKFGKMGFEGSMDNVGGKYMIQSAKALEHVATMFAGLTKQSVNRIDNNAIMNIVKAVKNGSNGTAIKNAIASTSGPDGVEALLKRINKAILDLNIKNPTAPPIPVIHP